MKIAPPLDLYRALKGIRRPRRFCTQPLQWYGNIFARYGVVTR